IGDHADGRGADERSGVSAHRDASRERRFLHRDCPQREQHTWHRRRGSLRTKLTSAPAAPYLLLTVAMDGLNPRHTRIWFALASFVCAIVARAQVAPPPAPPIISSAPFSIEAPN